MSNDPIRVLRVIARLNVGGPALHVSYLSDRLDRLGYETMLVAGQVSPSEGSMERVAEDLGLGPVYLPGLHREISPLQDAGSVRRLVRLIREFRPHVLHTHTAKAGAVGRAAALLAGEARPAAVVHTFHGHVLRGYFDAVRTRGFLELERALARTTDALIAVSPEVRDDLVRLGVASADRFAIVRLGIDLDERLRGGRGDRAELGLDPDAFVVGWFGRMTEIKRVDDLIRAFSELRIQEPRAVLLLVGDGPLRPGVERLAWEFGVDDAVRFVGFRPDVGSLYGLCDVLALTSANEGTPVVAIEALAAGVPVVATAVGGMPDVVADGATGFLVAPGDVHAVAERLARLAADAELRGRFSEEARRSVRARYSVDRLVGDIDLLYRSLLDEADAVRRRSGKQIAQRLPRTLPRAPTRASRRLRIAIVSQYFPPEVGATQSRMQSFAEHLSDRGHDVTVICEVPNHPQGVIPPEYRGVLVEDDRANDYRVLRTWVKASAEKTQATRLEFYVSFMGMAVAVAPRLGLVDVVLATTPPLFTAVAGLALARINRAPFVLDVRDLWPAAATSLNQISGGRVTEVAELLERELYRAADTVVAVTQPFCAHVDALRGRPPSTSLIPNGTLDLFFADAQPERRDDSQFVATFAGNFGIAQALPSLLDAAALLDGDARIQLVGEGPMKETLLGRAAELRLSNVEFRPQVPLDQIAPVLTASDALLVTLSGHPTFRSFLPSKLIDFMATGRPVIVSAAGEAASLAERTGGALAVPPEDPVALADAIRLLRDDPARGVELAEQGRAFARTRLRSEQAARMEAVLVDAVARYRSPTTLRTRATTSETLSS